MKTSKKDLAAVSLVALTCWTVYGSSLNGPFIFDDYPNIVENSRIRIATLNTGDLLDAAFNKPNSRRPVPKLSFALNYYFGKYNVRGYRLLNILIHMLNGMLVYFLAKVLFSLSSSPTSEHPQAPSPSPSNRPGVRLRFFMALFAALLFTAHPIQTQSVSYIVQRMTSMAVMFYLISLMMYVYGRVTVSPLNRWGFFAGGLAAWVLALGSKEIALVLPITVFLFECFFSRISEVTG